jgi:competence protein ComEC
MVLTFWACLYACGVATAVLWPSYIVIEALIGLGIAVWLAIRGSRAMALAGIALTLGACLGARAVAQSQTSQWQIPENTPVRVLGQVVSGPEQSQQSHKTHFRLAVQSVDTRALPLAASVSVTQGVPDCAPGDEIAMRARLFLPRGLANPGLPDARLMAKAQGTDVLASVRSAADIEVLPGQRSPLGWPRQFAFRLRTVMARAIDRQLDGAAAAFVRTMVLGERTEVSSEIEEGFRAAGATHVLSVSGLHLAVVAALVFWLLRRLMLLVPSGSLSLNPNTCAAALSLPVIGLYTLLTGEAVATVRSALMAAIAMGALLVNRPFSLGASIAFAGLVLLVVSPLALLDVSFQLSFASVIALGFFAQRFAPAGPAPKAGRVRRGLIWLLRSLAASFVAGLGTMPLVAHHFGEVAPASPIGNLMLVPLVELAVLPCGFVGSLLGLIHPWLGWVPLWIAGWTSRVVLAGAELFRRWAPIILVRYPNLFETAVLLTGAGCLLYGFSRGVRRRTPWLLGAIAACLLATGSLVLRDHLRRHDDQMRVTFIDVGQGDSALVEGPGGFVMLVDGGGRYDDAFDTGARVVEPVLRARGIGRVDLVVLSHPHPDHLNGLLRVLARFSVGALWTNGDDGHNPKYSELLAIARRHEIATPEPSAFESKGMLVQPLGPWLGDHVGVPPGLDANNASLIVRVGYAGRTVLLTGDIGIDGEAELVAREATGLRLASDVIKVPHHGSRTSSGEALLAAVNPSLAVVSVGKHNTFHLPNPATLARYAERAARLYRTDLEGAVTLTIDARGKMNLVCQRGCLSTMAEGR